MPARTAKLYGIVRADLTPGLRTAQVGHALIQWALEHGEPPENLVILRVADLPALERLRESLGEGRIVAFREPDLGGDLTALAAGPEFWRALGALPLLR